jgi:hypothetical protein
VDGILIDITADYPALTDDQLQTYELHAFIAAYSNKNRYMVYLVASDDTEIAEQACTSPEEIKEVLDDASMDTMYAIMIDCVSHEHHCVLLAP